MKEKILKIAVATMVVAAAGYGVFQGQAAENTMSELTLANIAALAAGEYETGDGGVKTLTCSMPAGVNGKYDVRRFCDSRTSATAIYPCLGMTHNFYKEGNQDRCLDGN